MHEDSESTHKAWRRLTEKLHFEGNVKKDLLRYDSGKDNPKKKIYSLYRRAAVAAIAIIAFGVGLLAMKPGEQVSLDKRTGKFTATRMNRDVSAWKSNMADYNSITLADLTKLLSRQYNVNITVKRQRLQQTRISITLNNALTINKIMEVLRSVTHANISRNDKDIVIK